MKTTFHPAGSRGHANHGWLNSYHTFSFAGYYNEQRIHFGALRVLNDDTVAGGMGFSKHPHDNMEIVSIPLSGDLEHNDSTGRHAIIKQGDVQIMSAGSGITHSEKNANSHAPVEFLQIWVFPKERNIAPRYSQKSFPKAERLNQLTTVVAPDNDNAVWINQNAWFTLGHFTAANTTTYHLNKPESGVYVFVINGEITVNGEKLQKRDGLGMQQVTELTIETHTDTEFLLMEVPMVLHQA